MPLEHVQRPSHFSLSEWHCCCECSLVQSHTPAFCQLRSDGCKHDSRILRTLLLRRTSKPLCQVYHNAAAYVRIHVITNAKYRPYVSPPPPV